MQKIKIIPKISLSKKKKKFKITTDLKWYPWIQIFQNFKSNYFLLISFYFQIYCFENKKKRQTNDAHSRKIISLPKIPL